MMAVKQCQLAYLRRRDVLWLPWTAGNVWKPAGMVPQCLIKSVKQSDCGLVVTGMYAKPSVYILRPVLQSPASVACTSATRLGF